MMKNTEWGAVAYFSYSKYGINTEVMINSNNAFKTGCALGKSSFDDNCANAYNTATGYKASTTGNITGIYDMSGGAWEYMAAYREETVGYSGFNLTELNDYAKYFDTYSASSSTNTYQYRILGDATGEMGPFYSISDQYYNNWYKDSSYFVENSYPWFDRGANYKGGSGAGQFNFYRDNGGSVSSYGTRLVLDV
jgi:hypothetical protein